MVKFEVFYDGLDNIELNMGDASPQFFSTSYATLLDAILVRFNLTSLQTGYKYILHGMDADDHTHEIEDDVSLRAFVRHAFSLGEQHVEVKLSITTDNMFSSVNTTTSSTSTSIPVTAHDVSMMKANSTEPNPSKANSNMMATYTSNTNILPRRPNSAPTSPNLSAMSVPAFSSAAALSSSMATSSLSTITNLQSSHSASPALSSLTAAAAVSSKFQLPSSSSASTSSSSSSSSSSPFSAFTSASSFQTGNNATSTAFSNPTAMTSETSFSLSTLLPDIINFFDNDKIQAALVRTAPSIANSLRHGTTSFQSIINNTLLLEPSIHEHPLSQKILLALPQYLPRLERNKIKLAQVVAQIPALVPVIPQLLKLWSTLIGNDAFGDMFSQVSLLGSSLGAGTSELLTSLSDVFSSMTVHDESSHADSMESSSSTSAASSSTTNAQGLAVHTGVTCNNCGACPIIGVRYKCSQCANYDLCAACEDLNVHNQDHSLMKIKQPQSSGPSPFPSKRKAFQSESIAALDEAEGLSIRKSMYGSTRHDQYKASFVTDVSLPEGSVVIGGEVSIKTWLVLNDGSLAWPEGSRVVEVSGDHLTNSREVFPVVSLMPDETGEVSVVIDVPKKAGHYRTIFSLIVQGKHFGEQLVCDVNVVDEAGAAVSSDAAASNDDGMSGDESDLEAEDFSSFFLAPTEELSDMMSDAERQLR